jgi:hypothetical protein
MLRTAMTPRHGARISGFHAARGVEGKPMDPKPLMDILGLREEPLGTTYTHTRPTQGVCPRPAFLPSARDEGEGKVNFLSLRRNWSCSMSHLRQARQNHKTAFFSAREFGCLGCAFAFGFLKPQLEIVARVISKGFPALMIKGERCLESAAAARQWFEHLDPRPAPFPYCVFKPLGLFEDWREPELVTFFGRAELIGGLNQLATFVTNDFEAVSSPFGSQCANLVAWPLRWAARGKSKAVLGGWDLVCRGFLEPDEISFTVPRPMFELMVHRWDRSFLTTRTWTLVRRRIERSNEVWRRQQEGQNESTAKGPDFLSRLFKRGGQG